MAKKRDCKCFGVRLNAQTKEMDECSYRTTTLERIALHTNSCDKFTAPGCTFECEVLIESKTKVRKATAANGEVKCGKKVQLIPMYMRVRVQACVLDYSRVPVHKRVGVWYG